MPKNAHAPSAVRVGLDLRSLDPGFKSHLGRGTGRYAMELRRQLVETPAGNESDISVTSLSMQDFALPRWKQAIVDACPVAKQTLATQLFLTQQLAGIFPKRSLSLMHFLAHGDAPARLRQPYVVTVLDLIPLRFPELYKPARMSWRYRLARFLELESIRHARGILAISEATKRDIVEMLGYPAERIVVTPLAVAPQFVSSREQSSNQGQAGHWREKQQLSADAFVFTYVGGIDPRKNIPFLLEAFHKLLHDPKMRTAQLVLAGAYMREREYPALLKQIGDLKLNDRVKLLGFLTEAELIELYRVSDAFVFPSLYEGFGFPVLESFASGTPVIAGKNSSIVEIAGDAALLLPDNDTEAWITAMRDIMQNTELRTLLRERGYRQVQQFSWSNTATKTREAYRLFAANGLTAN